MQRHNSSSIKAVAVILGAIFLWRPTPRGVLIRTTPCSTVIAMVAEYLACFSSPLEMVIICVGAATCASSLLASVFVAAMSESTAPQSEDDYYEAKPVLAHKLVYSKPSPTGSCIRWNGGVRVLRHWNFSRSIDELLEVRM